MDSKQLLLEALRLPQEERAALAGRVDREPRHDVSTRQPGGFTDQLDAAMEAILERPDAWPTFDHGTRRYLQRRYPFSVVYRIEQHRILIVPVAHGHRRPGYWKTRTQRT